MVRNRVGLVFRAGVLTELAQNQALKGVGLQKDSTRPQFRAQAGGPGQKNIACEDGHRVVPHVVRCRGSAANGSFVHDVIVVERGQVRQFDNGTGFHNVKAVSVSPGGQLSCPLRGQKNQRRAYALAAGRQKITGRFVSQTTGLAHGFVEERLNLLKLTIEVGAEISADSGESTRFGLCPRLCGGRAGFARRCHRRLLFPQVVSRFGCAVGLRPPSLRSLRY